MPSGLGAIGLSKLSVCTILGPVPRRDVFGIGDTGHEMRAGIEVIELSKTLSGMLWNVKSFKTSPTKKMFRKNLSAEERSDIAQRCLRHPN